MYENTDKMRNSQKDRDNTKCLVCGAPLYAEIEKMKKLQDELEVRCGHCGFLHRIVFRPVSFLVED